MILYAVFITERRMFFRNTIALPPEKFLLLCTLKELS